ncbi:tripartite motif-containing protein 75-like [Sorex araneus]|uniref:tripartite motif-containing protein 75-like n=1 Tax=Sorex araneus TaxID=42254 RepID=UPI002433BF80|nr:tripartite motif-containing protein 75-like [Sorex araneus]
MAVSSVLATVQAEIICPICLEYFNNPLTINCGHNFCASCIKFSWLYQRETFPCPVCRYPHKEIHFSTNPQLGRLADLAQILHSSRGSETAWEKEHRCEEHKQVVSLFCEDDRELLCPLCAQGPAHQDHHVRSVAKAAAHHRQRLRGYIEPLKKRLAGLQKLLITQNKNLLELREQVEKEKLQLGAEFSELNLFVEHEQETTFFKLDQEDKTVQQKLTANFTAISGYIDTLSGLLSEVAEKTVLSEGRMLREVKSIQHKHNTLEFPSLWTVHWRPEGYSLPPLCSQLDKIIQKFQEEVTLDPQKAHPSLHMSEDRKSVVYLRNKTKTDEEPERYPADVAVLGSEGYSSGRHYWEVQVGNKPEWAVGVCTDAPSVKGQPPLLGQNRSWTVQLQNGTYLAGGSVPVLLSLKDKPTGIGIYLDYELGQISFYDASDRSHIHSLLETFSDVLKPYFRVGQDSTPLIVSAIRDSTK